MDSVIDSVIDSVRWTLGKSALWNDREEIMSKDKLCTADELREMEMRHEEQIVRAVDGGDYEQARELVRQVCQLAIDGHEFRRTDNSKLLDLIARCGGDEALKEAGESMKDKEPLASEQLRESATRIEEQIGQAIDGGGFERAKELTGKLHRLAMASHDADYDAAAGLFSFIGRRFGDEVLKEAMDDWSLNMVKLLTVSHRQAGDARARMRIFAEQLKGHYRPIEITEDDEKFIAKMKPCGTGGRMVLEGKYGPPPGFHNVCKAQSMTYWREDFPVYCCHGPVMAIQALTSGYAPPVLEIAAEKICEDPCEFWLFKDPEAISAKAYHIAGVPPEVIPEGA